MRLFSAIYPPVEAAEHLAQALDRTAEKSSAGSRIGLRWIPRDQWHLTMAFHGEVADNLVPGYLEALALSVEAMSPFEIQLESAGSFGSRVLWVGVDGAVDSLRVLGSAVQESAVAAGLRIDPHAGQRPHLTVARTAPNRRDGAEPLDRWVAALADYRGPRWAVRAVRLIASELGGTSGGPRHQEVAMVRLGHRGRQSLR